MKIYLMGAEQPTNARLLREADAKHIGLSFHSLFPRLPKKSEWLAAERLHTKLYLASGGHMVAKKKPELATTILSAYEEFVVNNADHIELATEWDGPLTEEERRRHRWHLAASLGDERLVVAWRGPTDQMAPKGVRVGVTSEQLKDRRTSSLLRQVTNRHGTQFHLLDVADVSVLKTGQFTSAATTAWLSPMRYGETIVFSGGELHRYNTSQKDQARKRHRTTITRAGFDAAAIEADDHEEISRFTVWSYAQLEQQLTGKKPPRNHPFTVIDGGDEDLSTVQVGKAEQDGVENLPATVDNSPMEMRNAATPPVARSGPRQMLPTLGIVVKDSWEKDAQGNQVMVERAEVVKGTVTLRACDTCHVQATCPAFQPAAECAYSFPVEIRTKDQMLAVQDALLAMQLDRIAFMRMQEELSGGYADPNTSSEVDRFMKMADMRKKYEEDAASFKFAVEARGSAGILQGLFGEQASKVRELDSPISSSKVIDEWHKP